MALSKFSESQLQELKKEFKTLNTVSEKYKFWQEKLSFPYYFTYTLSHSEIIDFYFEGNSPGEREILNQIIIDEVSAKGTLKFYDSEKMTGSFALKLQDIVKPIPFIEEELNKIKSLIKSQEQKSHRGEISNVEEYSKAHFFMIGYQDFYLKAREVDLSKHNLSTPNLISLLNGSEIAKYRLFLETKIKNPASKKISEEHSEAYLKEQILILHFLGILKTLETTTNKNKYHLLSRLLNKSESKVKAVITYLDRNSDHNPNTVQNLEKVIALFEKTGYSLAAENAKIALSREKGKRK